MDPALVSRPDFYFDVMSPYAWLAAERIEALLGPVEWKPVLLGGIFVATGRTSWGVTQTREHGMAEVERRADRYGLGPVVWPEPWPGDALLAMRVAVAAGAQGFGRDFAIAAMRLGFLRGRVLGDRAAVEEAVRTCGVEPDGIVARATSPAGKADLRSRTEEALARGVLGVPTVISDGETVFGDDQLEGLVPRGAARERLG